MRLQEEVPLDAKLVYNSDMPTPTIVSAIVSSVLNAVMGSASQPSDQVLQEMAYVRTFPAETRRGEMQPPMQGEVVIDGRTLYLTPGAQIRNTDNRIVMPSSIQEPAYVRYIADASGSVSRVWMLTSAEVSAPDQDK